jgi:hypothetical protein
MIPEIKSAYKSGNLILFVGAGISKNLGLPVWSELIDHIANELGYDPEIFRSFGENLALAEFYRLKKGKIGPLRSWMDTKWHGSDIKIESSEIHKLIVGSSFQTIYTTNYDRWLEKAYEFHSKQYVKISGISDMANTKKNSVQIVKFHGDFDSDESIVLDETSYYKRMEFETPLDIKLRSDVLGKSVLFIGYGLNDANIRYLFYKLSMMWKSHAPGASQPKSYFFTNWPNPIQKEVLAQWGIEMIVSEINDPKVAHEEFLKELLRP